MRRQQLTVRWRLTALFAVAYLSVAALLIVTAYVIVRQRLTDRNLDDPAELLGDRLEPDFAAAPGSELLATLEDVRSGIVDDTLSALLTWLTVAALVAGAAAIAAGWYTAGRALSPVRRVTATARRLSEQNLGERVNYSGPPDELAELAETFDTMLNRIQSGVDAQRQFTAMASHELRTPLSQIIAATSLARSTPAVMSEGELITIVEPAATRAADLVDRLLELMRSRHRLAGTEPVRLDELAQEVLARHDSAIGDKGLTIHLDLHPVTVDADPILLNSMLTNLIGNAINHNLERGNITVRTVERDGAARFHVSNSGQPVTDFTLRRMTEPFQRGVKNPDGVGHGLGTTIVRTIAEAHSGTVRYTTQPRGGIAVEVILPIAA